jgi:hypothetical protein
MWVEMETLKVYYDKDLQIKKCFNKSFVLNAMKARVFPENFSTKTNRDLLEKAGMKESEDFLIKAQNIAKLVRKLMELKEVPYITRFETISV